MVFKFLRQRPTQQPEVKGVQTVVVTGIAVIACLLGVRQLGWLQPLELIAFDAMVRLRSELEPDPRLLIVGIDEADIQAQKEWPLSDQVFAQTLAALQRHQPRAIGLDVYRDFPREPGSADLQAQLQAPNVVIITKIGTRDNPAGIPAPQGIPPEQVGFNDVITDPDGVIRRNFLSARIAEGTQDEQRLYSFALRLSILYLAEQQLFPQPEPGTPRIHWGKATFVPLEAHSGGYHNSDEGGYQILLNYRRNRKAGLSVTLNQVLQGEVPSEWVRDKIVLIGTTAISGNDFFYTPYSAAAQDNPRVPGVEIHAQMVSQILDAVLGDRRLFRFWSEGVEILWIAGWVVLSGTVAWKVRHPILLSLGSIALLGSVVGVSFGLLTTQQIWVPVASPVLGAMVAGGVIVAYRAQQAQRQQQMVMTLLGQNTSPEVAAALWSSRDRLLKSGKLPGQKLTATMIFTDIKDFSSISEQMPPEVLLEWLNEYLAVLTEEVQTHQGIVNKFTGDGMMAVFGVPVARTQPSEIQNDAQRAVACALAVGDKLQALNQDWQGRGLPTIQMRAGIFTGPVVVGSLGGKERMEYGVIGDSVNIASRLESCEKDRQSSLCRVLIAHETLELLQGKFEVEHWGLLALKGKQQMVDVYRVVGYSLPAGDDTPPLPSAIRSIVGDHPEHFLRPIDVKESTTLPKSTTI